MDKRPHTNQKDISEEKYDFKSTWGRLISYCKPHTLLIIIALIAAVLSTILTLIGPGQLSEMTDAITKGMIDGIDLDLISSIGFLLIFIYVTSALLSYIQGFIMAGVTQKVSKQLREDISTKINRLPLKYFDTTSYGDILSRVTNDIDTIGQTMNQSIGNLVSAIALLLGSVIMMFKTNITMSIVAILSSLIGFVLMIVIISRSQKYFVEQQKYLGQINGHIEEVYSGHNVVKAYNAEEELHYDFQNYNKKLYKSNWKSQFFSGLMMPLMGFIGNIGYVAVCISGAILVLNESISIGTIVAFIVYVRLFTQPLSQIAQAATSLQSTEAASYRVFEFLDEHELVNDDDKTTKLEKVIGNIDFNHVTFGYKDGENIIKNFTAKIYAGQKVAIVGPTGSGKTTLVNLLMKFYELNSGSITIDGVPFETMSRENVHQLFCMVLQDTWLFEGTVKENIIYNKKGISSNDVIKACKAVGLDHFINTLPKGYNTVLNEEVSLSAGQKQLMTIARAMIEDAPILILDEATSSIDTRTEILIQKAMDKLMEGRTSIVIAHRLSTIKNADNIIVLKDGEIIETGDHDELMVQNGFYCDLYNSQFTNI